MAPKDSDTGHISETTDQPMAPRDSDTGHISETTDQTMAPRGSNTGHISETTDQPMAPRDSDTGQISEARPNHGTKIFCLFCCLTSQVNSYCQGGAVSSPNHNFFMASLNKQLTSTSCTYFRL